MIDKHSAIGPVERAHADDWFALHVFLSDAALADRFLLDWAGPTVKALLGAGSAQSWFFLRYWESGPHLRVRVRGLSEPMRQVLLERARAVVPSLVSADPPQRDSYYRHHFFDGQPLDPATLSWFEEGSVVVHPYEPEWRRYGGLHAMQVNEQLFDLSSTLALSVIRASERDLPRRFALAASLMPLFALAWAPGTENLLRFFEDYVAYWSASSTQVKAMDWPVTTPPSAGQCEQLAHQIRSARAQRPPATRTPAALLMAGLDAAVLQWDELREQGRLVSVITGVPVHGEDDCQRTFQAMLASQLHMLNNRLGLAPLQEVALARGLARTARALLASQPSEPIAA
jgi:thiopeptide-type bacteriocin biosynthesis protein